MPGVFLAGRGWLENSGRGCFPGLGKRGLWGKARATLSLRLDTLLHSQQLDTVSLHNMLKGSLVAL